MKKKTADVVVRKVKIWIITRTRHRREEQQRRGTWTIGTRPKETGNQEEKFNCEEWGGDVEKEGVAG